VSSAEDLDPQVTAHDLVVSLVPYVYHAGVIRSAIKSKTNVVTTSYISPAIKELDAAAKEAGIVVLNEVGVDPGVDHLYAIKKIDEIHEQGGKV
jgi:saccharopine dehydrogenase-like NADP-dependent oxidoreductase